MCLIVFERSYSSSWATKAAELLFRTWNLIHAEVNNQINYPVTVKIFLNLYVKHNNYFLSQDWRKIALRDAVISLVTLAINSETHQWYLNIKIPIYFTGTRFASYIQSICEIPVLGLLLPNTMLFLSKL